MFGKVLPGHLSLSLRLQEAQAPAVGSLASRTACTGAERVWLRVLYLSEKTKPEQWPAPPQLLFRAGVSSCRDWE